MDKVNERIPSKYIDKFGRGTSDSGASKSADDLKSTTNVARSSSVLDTSDITIKCDEIDLNASSDADPKKG